MKTTCIKNILLLTGIIALQACQPEGYTIHGNLTGDVEGKTVYLYKSDNCFQSDRIDSTIIQNGQFQFKGKVTEPEIFTIKIFPDSTRALMNERGFIMRPIIPVLIDNTPVEITACLDSIPLDFDCMNGSYDYSKIKIKGSPLYQIYMSYKQARTNLAYKRSNTSTEFYDSVYTEEGVTVEKSMAFAKESDAIDQEMAQKMSDFITKNKDNAVGLYILKECMTMFDAPTLEKLTSIFPAKVKENPAGKALFAKVDSIRSCAIGAPFIDADLFDKDGNAIKLSDYIGKGNYTLLEFWASWCGPCRGEIPHLKHVHKLYHPEGFDIISISMDAKKEDWLKAINAEGMAWTQASDLKAFESVLNKLYNFNSIPYCLLISPEGKIMHRNARGPFLDTFMIQLYGNKFDKDYRLYK